MDSYLLSGANEMVKRFLKDVKPRVSKEEYERIKGYYERRLEQLASH